MSDLLHVQQRASRGKQSNRQLRRSGRLPAVLYGHGETPVSLSLAADELEASLRHGAKVLDLAGDASGKALLQEIQWDTFFQHILHVDLLRVVAGEKVTVEVPIELRGESPGALSGGILEQLIHSVEIEASLDAVPEKLHLNINHLEIDGELAVKDIEDLPPGATVMFEADEVIIHCTMPVAEEEGAEEGAVAEPEIIGKGKDEEQEGDEKE